MNLKKNYLKLLLILFCLITKQNKAQITLSPNDTTFAQIYAKYSTLPVDSDFDSDYNKWKRMEEFWTKRLPDGGSFKNYNAAYKQLYSTFNSSSSSFVTSSSNLSFGNWQSNGPTSISNYPLNLGRADRIQVDPDDPSGNTIYACSTLGGIFKTIDGGLNWINYNTDFAFGTLNITEIKLAKDGSGNKYLYASVGGGTSNYDGVPWVESTLPFDGIYRILLNGTGIPSWQNLTGNLTCSGMLSQDNFSLIYKILIDPTNINNVYLATSKGVFYTCNSGCTPNVSPCGGPIGLTWKKSNLNTAILGLDFDYSDPTYKSLYCSFKQIWYTSDIINSNFNLISSTNSSSTYLFNDLANLPTGMSSGTSAHLNICTHPSYPNNLFISATVNGNPTYLLKYDKTINPTAFPNNFFVKYTASGFNDIDKNFIHINPNNTNIIAFNSDKQYFTAVQNSIVTFFDMISSTASSAYVPHGDNHDFDFSPNNYLIGSNDGGVYKVQINPSVNYINDLNGNGMAISRITGGSVWEKTGKDAAAGLQDNFTEISNNLGINTIWSQDVNGLTYDGGPAEYLANGTYYSGSLYSILYLSSNSSNNNIYPSCAGFKLGSNYLKNIDGSNGIYFGGEELLYTNPNFTSGNCSGNSNWYTLSNLNTLRVSSVDPTNQCYQNFVSSFDVSADQKTIYASHYNSAATWLSTCQAIAGNYVPIYKTTQGGINNPNFTSPCTSNCWTALANASTLKLAGRVIAVAMHPANTNKVWVGSGGNVDPLNPTYNRHIVYSSDGGATWSDFSNGLPNFSVNDIVVRKGTDYEIYAATDIGVYYTTSTTYGTSGWQRVSNNLPYVTVSDIQIDNCNNKLYAYTYGRGMWSIDLPTTNNPGPMPSVTLSQNTTYTGTKYIMNDIIIPAGKVLSINAANIFMAANTSIIVQPGARLDVINSTIEGYCDKSMWSHILAQGVATQPQVYAAFDPYHGIVNINNSTIKDAGQAAVTCENGGYVLAQNSNFINNRKGLEFHYFPISNNYSRAINCTFDYNDNLKDLNQTIDAHITAWAIDGLKISGCTFKNTALPGSNFNNLGNGIYSIDAFYTVDNVCGGCGTPPSTTGRSLFSNLNYGIYSQASVSSLKTLNLRNADFQDCYYGTYIKSIDFAKVQWCNYANILDVIPSSGINPYGLYFDNCQNYFCENNNFNGIVPGVNNNFGLIVNSASVAATRAYYCDFNYLAVGSTAYFDNYNNIQGKGLRFNCNKYTANQYDAAIIGGYVNGSNTDIDHVQGNWTSAFPSDFSKTVRNLYSANCIFGDNQWYDDGTVFGRIHVNLNTQSGNGGSYFTRPQPGCYIPSKLNISTLIGNFTRNSSICPIIGSGGCSTCNPSNLSQSISANKQNLINAQLPLTAGASATLLSAVNSNMSPGQLKNLLSQNSPYLSDIILASYFSKSSTPPGHAKDIHSLNAPVADTVWQIIVAKNYPNGIFNQMQSAQTTSTLSGRTNQEGLVSSIAAQIDYLYNEKLRLFMADSTYRNNDSLKANILASNYADKAIKIIDFYINTQQYNLAADKIKELSANPQYSQYAQFKTDLISGLNNPEGVLSLKNNAGVKNRTMQLATTNFALGQKQAQALSNFVWGDKYSEFTALPNNTNGSRIIDVDNNKSSNLKIGKDDFDALKIIPNPSFESTSILYKLPNNALIGKILITDVTGKIIQYYEVITSLNQIYFNTSNLSGGIYFVNLICNNSIVKSQKLIVLK